MRGREDSNSWAESKVERRRVCSPSIILIIHPSFRYHKSILPDIMETIHSQRQSRLANLRAQKETGSSSNPTAANAASSSSALIHPFRRAFLSNTTSRLRATARDDLNAATSSSKAAEASAQQIADSSSEGQTLRRYRNWDPTTGQPRTGLWNTISSNGIEEEMKNVQSDVLKEDAIKRNQELDLMNIAPKRVNWDLKRDMVKRLKKLERRDKECRLILIRELVLPLFRDADEKLTRAFPSHHWMSQVNASRQKEDQHQQLKPLS